ncbi:MAG TPA: hypothetical protein ENG42_00540 [Candidatus Aenigmarchaeota archaeon]|nr:MAG: hypothetical protein DRP03_02840 [Candidatus Aenigmarchaeota archaeon]HDD45939.1 hypothetical protein [Candidatus Aenigmarchaeota archaeon]
MKSYMYRDLRYRNHGKRIRDRVFDAVKTCAGIAMAAGTIWFIGYNLEVREREDEEILNKWCRWETIRVMSPEDSPYAYYSKLCKDLERNSKPSPEYRKFLEAVIDSNEEKLKVIAERKGISLNEMVFCYLPQGIELRMPFYEGAKK